MTYIVGMVCDDGLIISADGLVRQYNTNTQKFLRPLHNERKVFPITEYICVAVAGVVSNFDDFINDYKRSYLQPYLNKNLPVNVKEIATHFGNALATEYGSKALSHGMDLEAIVGGYNSDTVKGAHGQPELYFYKLSVKTSSQNIYATSGVADGGYVIGVRDWVERQYRKQSKDFRRLRRLSNHAIRKSSKLYPQDVGGTITAYRIRVNGVTKCNDIKIK